MTRDIQWWTEWQGRKNYEMDKLLAACAESHDPFMAKQFQTRGMGNYQLFHPLETRRGQIILRHVGNGAAKGGVTPDTIAAGAWAVERAVIIRTEHQRKFLPN